MELSRAPQIAPAAIGEVKTNNGGAQATQLPEHQSVQPAEKISAPTLTLREVPIAQKAVDDAEDAKVEKEEYDQPDGEVRREFEFDRDASALIFRAIDLETGEVIKQYPEEARLNLRAYLTEKQADDEIGATAKAAVTEDKVTS